MTDFHTIEQILITIFVYFFIGAIVSAYMWWREMQINGIGFFRAELILLTCIWPLPVFMIVFGKLANWWFRAK